MANKTKNKSTASEISAQSLGFLGLSKQPFNNEILSGESYFGYQALTKITESLIHQVQFSELLLLVEGIHGAGKTSLFRQFIQTDITNTKILSIQAEATDTLVQIQQKMSIHLQELGDANHLDDNLKSLKMFDQIPLMVINNSHVLSDTTLQELLRYQQQLKQEFEVGLKILLFANTGMAETLQKISDISADAIYVQTLPALSPKQADNFIMHRLRCAGYSAEPLFDDNDIQQLLKKCNGTPLDIMAQAVPLIDKIITKKLKPSSALWLKALIALVILCTVIAGSYIAYTLLSKNNTELEPAAALLTEPTITQPVISEETILNNETDVIEMLENDTHSTEIVSHDETDIKATHINNDLIAELNAVEEQVEEKTTTPEIMQTAVEPTKAVSENITRLEEPKVPVNETKASTPIHPALLQLDTMGLNDINWLRSQNTNNWTLQLLGAREPETLLKFAQRHNLTSDTTWYKTWLKAKPYYVLIHGNYASRDEARLAVADLPPQIRAIKPWVKSLKSIQKSIQ